ncbi:MAG: tetratricopeptide repeat protein [Methyloceanibacter sp.]|jgi:TPR repeat protein|uniref:tetratricopeptide repeat protein n=1 Tax=Methyloceanibacter sp. TaxID=1965321 RepID=UPI003C38D016
MSSRKVQLGVAAALCTTVLGFSLAYIVGEQAQSAQAALVAANDPALEGLISDARELQKVGKWSEANRALTSLASDGHPAAMYHLARSYKYGWGVDPNLETTRKWLMQAVRYDFAYRGETAYEIGRLYQKAEGENCDAIAVAWFNKALSWGFEKAHVQLAHHFRYGSGVKPSTKRALYHYEKAAIAGYPTSTIQYAQWLLRGGTGVLVDDEKAQYWGRQAAIGLTKKANGGSSSAAKTLGRLYRDGVFVRRDFAEAERWFRRSSRLGDSGGMHELAVLMLRERDENAGADEALGWLRMAAELGHGGAVTGLGRLHLKRAHGLSDVEAVGLFEKGVALRHPGSMEELARLLAEGRLVTKDPTRAYELAQEGAKLGHKGAKALLSELETKIQSSSAQFSKS